jgi:hypothetical protein
MVLLVHKYLLESVLKNLSGSTLILTGDGLKINFPVAQVVHIKSEDL